MTAFNYLKSVCLALGIGLGSQAAAGTAVSASYPDSLVSALQDMGYKAELTTDDYGDPLILSASSGVTLVLEFYGCDDAGENCRDLLLGVAYDMPNGMDVSAMQSWNANKRIGQAFLDDESDPALQHYVVNVDGMPRESFEILFEYWVETVEEFSDFIDW